MWSELVFVTMEQVAPGKLPVTMVERHGEPPQTLDSQAGLPDTMEIGDVTEGLLYKCNTGTSA